MVLDVTGGTTPMRFGAALAAMTRGIKMVHQRVPQRFVDGDWVLDESRQREIVPMNNPLESTGFLREGQAVELFNRRDYSAAAQDLKSKLEAILHDEPPYDIYVRWKPLHEQPVRWEPDLNDGVRLNIRPFVTA